MASGASAERLGAAVVASASGRGQGARVGSGFSEDAQPGALAGVDAGAGAAAEEEGEEPVEGDAGVVAMG